MLQQDPWSRRDPRRTPRVASFTSPRERSTLAVWLRRDANGVDLGWKDGKSRRVGMCKTWTMRCFLLISHYLES